ncbi:secretion protein, partial [Burkholderia pseudomallei]
DLLLQVKVEVVRAQFVETDAERAPSASDSSETVLFVDLAPMQFDSTVLCVGPDSSAWPSEFDLLSTLFLRRAPQPLWRD